MKAMKVGDLVQKVWGEIRPEWDGAVGLVVEISRPPGRWETALVEYPFGQRWFLIGELCVLSALEAA